MILRNRPSFRSSDHSLSCNPAPAPAQPEPAYGPTKRLNCFLPFSASAQSAPEFGPPFGPTKRPSASRRGKVRTGVRHSPLLINRVGSLSSISHLGTARTLVRLCPRLVETVRFAGSASHAPARPSGPEPHFERARRANVLPYPRFGRNHAQSLSGAAQRRRGSDPPTFGNRLSASAPLCFRTESDRQLCAPLFRPAKQEVAAIRPGVRSDETRSVHRCSVQSERPEHSTAPAEPGANRAGARILPKQGDGCEKHPEESKRRQQTGSASPKRPIGSVRRSGSGEPDRPGLRPSRSAGALRIYSSNALRIRASSAKLGSVTRSPGVRSISRLIADTAPSLRAQLRRAMPLFTSQSSISLI